MDVRRCSRVFALFHPRNGLACERGVLKKSPGRQSELNYRSQNDGVEVLLAGAFGAKTRILAELLLLFAELLHAKPTSWTVVRRE